MLTCGVVPRVRFVRVRHPEGIRQLAVLDPRSRETFVRLVATAAPLVEAALPSSVVANRVAEARTEPPFLRLRSWRSERRAFAHRLMELAERSETLAFADVRDCYASISPRVVGSAIRELGAGTAARLESFLGSLALGGVRGLPVGPDPSAVLANAVLLRVDRALARAGIEHLRWVDDVVLASRGPADAERSLEVLRSALGEIGLRLNETKTRVVADPTPALCASTVSGCGGAGVG